MVLNGSAEGDNALIIKEVMQGCLDSISELSSLKEAKEIVRKVLHSLSRDYPPLEGVNVSQDKVVIKNPQEVNSMTRVNLARAMNLFITRSLSMLGSENEMPKFRQNMSKNINQNLNMKIRDAGICL